ncbi:uncharacterized protein LOC118482672 [Helianthus annuus]|uniref:uncharacterized protein LOC118482672 n=1 Tax=Helianthus annuus TaxID=4232 RepID=UPI001652BA18|nr:uncharacterized protein LOC118482672 [Helianthus annuus]
MKDIESRCFDGGGSVILMEKYTAFIFQIQTLNCVRIPDSCTGTSTNDNASAPTICDGGSRYLPVTVRVNWNVLEPPPTTMLLRQQPRERTPSVWIGSSCCGTGY